MTAQITQLLRLSDNRDTVEAQLAAILVQEAAAQASTAATGAIVEYERAGTSDYLVAASQDEGSELEEGTYTATAGELVAGVGTWTLVPPGGGAGEECETEAADDPLLFPETGLTLTVTPYLVPFETGDVVQATIVDSDDYRIKVYSGWCNPIGNWLEAPDLGSEDSIPRVHVWFDRQNFERAKSDVIEKQQGPGTFFVDVYGYGKAYDTDTGHVPAGTAAGDELRRALAFVRQILMAGHYVTLGLEGVVAERFPESIEYMPEPLAAAITVQHVVAARLTLSIDFIELSPQVIGEPIEIIATTISRQEDGEVLLEVTQDWSGA